MQFADTPGILTRLTDEVDSIDDPRAEGDVTLTAMVLLSHAKYKLILLPWIVLKRDNKFPLVFITKFWGEGSGTPFLILS